MAKEVDININVNKSTADAELDELNSQLQEVEESTEDLNEGLDDMTGALGSSGKAAVGFGKQLKALALNPVVLAITAVVGALGILADSFKFTAIGAFAVEESMAGLSAGFDEGRRRVGEFARGLGLLVVGEGKAGLDAMKEAMYGFSEATADASEQGRRLYRLTLAHTLAVSKNAIKTSELNDELNAQRLIANNLDFDARTRLEASRESLRLQEEITEVNLRNARGRQVLAKAEFELAKGTKDHLEAQVAVNEAEANFNNVSAQGKTASIRFITRIGSIQKEIDRERIEVDLPELLEAEAEFRDEMDMLIGDSWKLFEELSDKEIEKGIERNEKILASYEKAEAKKRMELQRSHELAVRLAELERQAKVGNALMTLNIIEGAVAEGSAVGKASALAQAIISTFEGANKALAQGGIFGFAGAGAIITAGLLNVRKIMAVQIPSGGGNIAIPSVSQPREIAQTIDRTQDVNVVNEENKEPLRAYVVSSEMSSQQELDRRIEKQATI